MSIDSTSAALCGHCQRPVIGRGIWTTGGFFHEECTHGPGWQPQQFSPMPNQLPGTFAVPLLTEEEVRRIVVDELTKRGMHVERRLLDLQDAVVQAALLWWTERGIKDWDEAELARAVIRLQGDWPGCPECNHDCGEPCVPATEAQQLAAIDDQIAQLVHDRVIFAPDDYRPPEGWKPRIKIKRHPDPAGTPPKPPGHHPRG